MDCWRLPSCSSVVLGKYVEAAIIAVAGLQRRSWVFPEGRAQALSTSLRLKSRLALNASVRRE